jgi:hypothetical protein
MRRLLPLLVCLISATASARVLSYAAYTDHLAMPAVQHRLNRHFALVEYSSTSLSSAQVVLYDTKGEEEPRVVYPSLGPTDVAAAAVREDDAQLAIFIQTSSRAGLLSVDRGLTWRALPLPFATQALMSPYVGYTDAGGPFVHARYGPLRIGTRDVPFVFATAGGLYGITSSGSVKPLLSMPLSLIGSARDGAQFLVRIGTVIASVDVFGNVRFIGQVPSATAFEGWITPDGGAYVESRSGSSVTLYYVSTGVATVVSNALSFSVPSADHAGAWIVTRSTQATTLSFHTPAAGLKTQWTDTSAPEVEALHPGSSGNTLLVQVHRPRVALDLSLFKDPALAVWHVGDPAPQFYDELFLAETTAKGFVHVNPDAIESGAPFVFDSGVPQPIGGGGIISPAPPGAGGGDITQEWGVVRASLAQRLVLPSAAHAPGAFGSFWMTDVTFYNPSDQSVNVTVRYSSDGQQKSIALGPREIRLVGDILGTLFGVESGGGALFITPDVGAAINVASRTYTRSSLGTFGFGMNAIDMYAAFGPRFPATFAGAILGANFRTNLALTDVSGRTSEATAWSTAGSLRKSYSAPPFGQQQINFLNDALGVPATWAGALVVQPTRGEALATVFAIDNRTNDATYFPPDIAASVVRVLPAVGHVDGANGTHYQTDLFLFNNGSKAMTVNMLVTMWNGSSQGGRYVVLNPGESRVIPDVLFTLWQRSGIARMRVTSGGNSTTDPSIRITARTYTTDAKGGTYGFLTPPLNSFQSGIAGDTLEILGPSLQKNFRTNVGLVDVSGCDYCPVMPRARIDVVDRGGATIASFETDVPAAGGMQINDLFHARGLPDTNEPVLIRVNILKGMLGAYGSMIDNGTNDSAYFAANLGSKQ